MIEIVIGALTLLGALVILTGAGDALHLPVGDLFPLLGFGGTALIAFCGALLMTRGFYRRRVARTAQKRHALRSVGLALAIVLGVLLLALGLPLVAEALDLVRLGGFPLGYYMSAQGALVALVALAFGFVHRQDAIDAADELGEKPGAAVEGA